jgi:mpaB/rubber oxygenase-like protein
MGDASRFSDEFLDRKRQRGDDKADGPVGDVLERGGVQEVDDLLQKLVHVKQLVPDALPPELKSYLVDTLPLPSWADLKKIDRAQRFFQAWGVHVSVCLFCASLPSSYAAADGVKVLYLTAELDTHTQRRIMETGQFLMDVLRPGGLTEDGAGRRAIQRVRLMHGAVRHLINERAKDIPGLWNREAWGGPINQEDLAGTLLAFSYVVAEPMRRLGVTVSPGDADAYLHMWNVVGYLLGVDEDMLVHDFDEATALVSAIRRRHFRGSPEGVEMTKALLDLLQKWMPFENFDHYVPELVRRLIGDDVADMVGVPARRRRRVPEVLGRLVGRVVGEPLVVRLVEPFGCAVLREAVKLSRGGDRVPFAIPDHLARSWELSS